MNDEALAEGRLGELPGGAEALERIAYLEKPGAAGCRSSGCRRPTGRPDVNVIFAGGGLWLTLALYLARLGLKVAVIERGRAGSGHREWNISGPELAPLTPQRPLHPRRGRADRGPLPGRRLPVARAGCGPCRGVLDHAIDGEAYLQK